MIIVNSDLYWNITQSDGMPYVPLWMIKYSVPGVPKTCLSLLAGIGDLNLYNLIYFFIFGIAYIKIYIEITTVSVTALGL